MPSGSSCAMKAFLLGEAVEVRSVAPFAGSGAIKAELSLRRETRTSWFFSQMGERSVCRKVRAG